MPILELLKEFYSNARYDRFSAVGNRWEYELISKFFSNNQISYEESVSDSQVILINDSIRKLIGRVLSRIVKTTTYLWRKEVINQELIHMNSEMIQKLRRYFYIWRIAED